MRILQQYISYIRDIRRYSPRTVQIYESALSDFALWAAEGDVGYTDDELVASLIPSLIRGYEASLLDADPPKSPKTVSLHLSALSGFCRYLMQQGRLKSNPVKIVPKPKVEKRIPHFFKAAALEEYFASTAFYSDDESAAELLSPDTSEDRRKEVYERLLHRLIIMTLYCLGIRRAELIGLRIEDVDFGRNVVKVHGKGDKMREIPLVVSLSEELLLYLKAVETMCGGKRSLKEPLFVTYRGKKLYPVYVDRALKRELGNVKGITGRKSPHVLRHSLATGLMNEGTDLYSIKQMLGHSSLASTQIYTHSSIARLKTIYEQAHPRAKKGGKNGD